MARLWDRFLTEQDQQVLTATGYGKRGGFGTRPALFIIDVQYNFLGDEPMPILEAIATYRTACGEEGWKAAHHIARLMHICRERDIPIFYTTAAKRPDFLDSGVSVGKNSRYRERTVLPGSHATQTVEILQPRPQDILIIKPKASAFFGTSFMSTLNLLDIDTLIVTGGTTSGCVRATTVDACGYNFKVVIPEEAVFDRFEISHASNLFDLNCKYADVIPVDEVAAYLQDAEPNKAMLPSATA